MNRNVLYWMNYQSHVLCFSVEIGLVFRINKMLLDNITFQYAFHTFQFSLLWMCTYMYRYNRFTFTSISNLYLEHHLENSINYLKICRSTLLFVHFFISHFIFDGNLKHTPIEKYQTHCCNVHTYITINVERVL